MTQTHKWLALGIFLILYLMAILYANRPLEGDFLQLRPTATEQGRIVAVHPAANAWLITMDMEILSGPFRGQVLEAEFRPDPLYDLTPQPGQHFSIELRPGRDGQPPHVLATNPQRRQPLMLMIGLFMASLLLIGGKKGIRAIAGIGFTLASIFFLLIPLMVRGYPVIQTTLLIVLLMSVMTVLIIGGSWPKMLTAILGTMVGVTVALGVSQIFGRLAHINGLHRNEALSIMEATNITADQMSALFTSGILIASLGAVLDTAMSIASALEEIRATRPKISPIKLLRSGMNVGRDAMGTMSGTLILAFVGASLNLVIMLHISDTSTNLILNDQDIAMEILRSISGSLGIIFAVPAVSFIGALLLGRTPSKAARMSEALKVKKT